MKETIKMDRIEDAIADFKEGKFVIVVDDEDRENEGDLIIAAEKITPEKVNFMLQGVGFTASGKRQYFRVGNSFYGYY